MSNRESNQAAHVAFSSTVASALARSVRDTPLRPSVLEGESASDIDRAEATAAADTARETR